MFFGMFVQPVADVMRCVPRLLCRELQLFVVAFHRCADASRKVAYSFCIQGRGFLIGDNQVGFQSAILYLAGDEAIVFW